MSHRHETISRNKYCLVVTGELNSLVLPGLEGEKDIVWPWKADMVGFLRLILTFAEVKISAEDRGCIDNKAFPDSLAESRTDTI